MRRIKVLISEQPSGTFGWDIRIDSSFPGDLLCRAADLGITRGWVALDERDGEAVDVEACLYAANSALMDLYDWVERNRALSQDGLFGAGVPNEGDGAAAGLSVPAQHRGE
jgi:hypothetical protein